MSQVTHALGGLPLYFQPFPIRNVAVESDHAPAARTR